MAGARPTLRAVTRIGWRRRALGELATVAGLLAWLYGALLVGLVGAQSGGYFPTTWGWVGVITFALAAIALLARERASFGRAEVCFVGSLAGFSAWVALSNLWTPSMTSTMHEVQRDLGYLGLALAALLVTRRRTVPHLLGGVTTAVTLLSVYGLVTRLFPDRFGGFAPTLYIYRLSPPIGYWNGLGIFAVMGILLALGFATRGQRLTTRALAGAAIPLLSTTMFFTFSRGAWVALAIGLVVAIAVDPRRLQLIAVGAALSVWPVLAIAAAHRRQGLTLVSSTFEQATHDGHSLFPFLLALAAGGAGTALIGGILERRVDIPGGARHAFAAIVIAAALGGAGVVWVTQGSPWTLAQRGWSQFKTPPQSKGSADVTQRLFSLRSNGRFDLWRVSLQSFERKPLHGNGAGTFWELWARNRHIQALTLEGHSLYFQVLGELGLPGLLLIAAALLAPLIAALRRRAQALVAPALGAYAAWLVHSGVDWDWDLMAVGACGLLIGVALLGPRDRELPQKQRAIAVTVCVALVLLVFEGLLGDRAINSARGAIARGNREAAYVDLRRASRLAPWSSQPDTLRGSSYLADGKGRLARRYLLRAVAKDRDSWFLWQVLGSVGSGAERTHDLAQAHRLNPYLGRP
jgi:hypothetical protein